MKSLFNSSDIELLKLKDYVSTFLKNEGQEQLFQLPPIQRNAVWNVAQIERLWDSLLRGFPVGSFIVSKRNENEASIDIKTNEKHEISGKGFFLLDGQQRTRSLVLGFEPTEDKRLWIDLDPQLNFGSSHIDRNDRKFMLRVITGYQPWGMNPADPSKKLSEGEKLQARNKLETKEKHYDYEVEIDREEERNQKQEYSWPLRSQLPIPLDSLIKLIEGIDDSSEYPDWSDVLKLVPTIIEELPNAPTKHYFEVVDALRKMLSNRDIILLLQEEKEDTQLENEKDPIEVLFTRVNSGGTPLQGEEMAYSLLKSSWDGCYNMVHHILIDDEIGYLLPSTKIIMSATRIARYEMGESDVHNPSINQFRRWIGKKGEKSPFVNAMEKLLEVDSNSNRSLFHQVMNDFCNLVLYREGDDVGLPRKLLLQISHHIYLPVFLWLYINRDRRKEYEDSRVQIIRFLLFAKLTIDDHEQAGREAFKIISESKPAQFPDLELYQELTSKGYAVPLPSVEVYKEKFEEPNGKLRSWHELFGGAEDPYYNFNVWFWRNSNFMLLWIQRREMAKWFLGYNPTSTDAYDTPYDEDHILPKAHMIVPGQSVKTDLSSEEHKAFDSRRYLYINSIGNYRLWPFWANRSDGDVCQTKKLRVYQTDFTEDLPAKDLGLISSDEFFTASAIELSQKQYWIDAQVEDHRRNWNEKRRIAFQNAVERRVISLYETFYKDLNYENWHFSTLPE